MPADAHTSFKLFNFLERVRKSASVHFVNRSFKKNVFLKSENLTLIASFQKFRRKLRRASKYLLLLSHLAIREEERDWRTSHNSSLPHWWTSLSSTALRELCQKVFNAIFPPCFLIRVSVLRCVLTMIRLTESWLLISSFSRLSSCSGWLPVASHLALSILPLRLHSLKPCFRNIRPNKEAMDGSVLKPLPAELHYMLVTKKRPKITWGSETRSSESLHFDHEQTRSLHWNTRQRCKIGDKSGRLASPYNNATVICTDKPAFYKKIEAHCMERFHACWNSFECFHAEHSNISSAWCIAAFHAPGTLLTILQMCGTRKYMTLPDYAHLTNNKIAKFRVSWPFGPSLELLKYFTIFSHFSETQIKDFILLTSRDRKRILSDSR